jgi:hypothetical protein
LEPRMMYSLGCKKPDKTRGNLLRGM